MIDTKDLEHKLRLMDDIDKLRSQGISHYVQLPQLIVCSDQSSGKSSVMEAISGIPFPVKDNLCARFATEVILRRNANTGISVRIVLGLTRSSEERARLTAFDSPQLSLEKLPELIEKAKSALGVTESAQAFAIDILRLEISGPTNPHLTIVDLPGLIHSENKLQSASDVEVIQTMVRNYMANPRSIILAIVSAKNDYANQIVLKLAKEFDSYGKRTLGIVTKPDTLPIGSGSEKSFVELVQNLDVGFRLGWHALMNRSFESRDCTIQERDSAEESFFNQGTWKELPRSIIGISTLRSRLSEVLFDQIRAELPALILDIESGIGDCQSTHARLGNSRATVTEQRLFLLQVSQRCQHLTTAALDSSYDDPFFLDPRTGDGFSRRLRALIQDQNIIFAQMMRTKGEYRPIVDRDDTSAAVESGGACTNSISRGEFIEEIRVLLTRTRGRELPGMFNPMTVGELLLEQSRPWTALARSHLQRVWEATKLFLERLVVHLTDEDTADILLGQVLMKPFVQGHPITYNHYFTETIPNVRAKRQKADALQKLRGFFGQSSQNQLPDQMNLKNARLMKFLDALTAQNELDMDRYACFEILDCMKAFYKVRYVLKTDFPMRMTVLGRPETSCR